jgi:hypothetical protein
MDSSVLNYFYTLKPSMIQKYLPDEMWVSFGGVNNFVNWLKQKAESVLSKEHEISSIHKSPLTKDTFPKIISQLHEKYPYVNMSDNTFHDLIVSDLLRRIFYLNYVNGKPQFGGYPLENSHNVSIGANILGLITFILLYLVFRYFVFWVKTAKRVYIDYPMKAVELAASIPFRVAAATGNETADKIVKTTFKESTNWPSFHIKF